MDSHPPHEIVSHHALHRTLAYSYLVYFFLLVIGVVLDFFFPIRIFHTHIMLGIGFLLLILSTALIYWAQRVNRDFHTNAVSRKEELQKGPYKYTSTPTNTGLFLLLLGFGFITNAYFIIFMTTLSFIITKAVFLKKHDTLMQEKHGEAYREYKQSIKL